MSTCILSSCNLYKYPYEKYAVAIDYSRFSEKGFFFTESNSANFEYKPIASISAIFRSGWEPTGVKNKELSDDAYGSRFSYSTASYSKNFIMANRDELLDLLYKKAIALGANGVINLKINTIRHYSEKTGYNTEGYEATGMAIKK